MLGSGHVFCRSPRRPGPLDGSRRGVGVRGAGARLSAVRRAGRRLRERLLARGPRAVSVPRTSPRSLPHSLRAPGSSRPALAVRQPDRCRALRARTVLRTYRGAPRQARPEATGSDGTRRSVHVDQYTSMVLEKTIADGVPDRPELPQHFPSSEMISHPLAPGLSPTYSHGELRFGSIESGSGSGAIPAST